MNLVGDIVILGEGIGSAQYTIDSCELYEMVYDQTIRAMTSHNGKHYIDINNIVYINSVTDNSGLAAEYLS